MNTHHGGYGTSQMPLAGAILCCTSIPPEQRAELAAIGAQMGAAIKLDLTSDVTHLIVGNINSAKYRYVAKSREDVKVLLPGWLEALRTEWMKGGDVDAQALEEQYRLPTFYGLKICLTGFDNPEQRKFIQDTVSQNGAEYHGDLTKSVTHLIAAMPSGKKYEHAVNWRMKIVAWEWFEQSRERGLVLDESHYHPTLPVEERGKGAWDRRQSTSPALGKRIRDAGQADMANTLRRKLRRSASSRMGSQSEALWAGITAGGFERKKDEEDDWVDNNLPQHHPQPVAPDAEVTKVAQTDLPPREIPTSHSRGPFQDEHDGIFAGRLVFLRGFDQSKTNILREHLDGNGAVVLCDPAELGNFSSIDLRQGFLVVPHDVQVDQATLPEGCGDMALVTNWWVERCLHGKRIVDPVDSILCRPFDKVSISGFNGLTINVTGFTGIELLQVTKAVTLFGAIYDEILSAKTSVMICNTRKPNTEKLRFATDKNIPAVHATWFWECIRDGNVQPYHKHQLSHVVPQPQKPKPRDSFAEVPTAPLSEEDSLKLRQKKAQGASHVSKPRGGTRNPSTLELSLSEPSTPASTTGSSTNPNTATNGGLSLEQDAQLLGTLDGAGSLPLQDINPSMNSPRRPSISSNDSATRPTTKTNSARSNSIDIPANPAPAQRKSSLTKEPVIPTADSVVPSNTESAPQEKPKLPETDYSDIMSKLLANRNTPNPTGKEEEKGRRRRRPLGRAQSGRSNQSTVDDKLSKQGSGSRVEQEGERKEDPEVEEEVDVARRPFEVPQPSQELGWDSPGAQKARVEMIRAMGGKVEEGLNILEGVGVVKDKAGNAGMGVGRSTRKRR